jgi:hypothetical protein
MTQKPNLIPDNSDSFDINPSSLSEEDSNEKNGQTMKKSKSNRDKRPQDLSSIKEDSF